MKRDVYFSPEGLREYRLLLKHNSRLADKAMELIEGKGKPEPLKGNLAGFWSRRINDEHRLIYRVTDDAVRVESCYGHYDDK